jgi:hypothetical protein
MSLDWLVQPVIVHEDRDQPMRKSLRVTPMNRTDYLRGPPHEITLRDLSIVRAGLQYVPERPTLCIVHHEVEVCRCLECTQ